MVAEFHQRLHSVGTITQLSSNDSEHTLRYPVQTDFEQQSNTDVSSSLQSPVSTTKPEASLFQGPPEPQRRRYGIFHVPPEGDPGPPPDGGMLAWMQAIAGLLIGVVTWGLITSFGIFQTDYSERLGASPSSISWIGTCQTFLLMLIGPISGRASDAGLVHESVLLGSVLIVLGVFMMSLATEYWQLFLSQGVCIGIGIGFVYMPGLSVPSTWFKKRKSLAAGIMASGNGIGGVIFPSMYKTLLPVVGFSWTIRAIGFVVLAVCIALNLMLRVRVPPRQSGPFIEFSAFRDPSYCFYTIGFFLVYWAVYFAFYYIDAYGHSFASFTTLDSVNILLITNGLGIPGRLLPGFIASRWLGPLNTAIPLALLVSVTLFSWLALLQAPTHGSVYAFSAVYGFLASALQASFSISLVSLTEDLSTLGTRMGMVFAVVAFAALTGSPLAGAIIEHQGGDYHGAVIWSALSVLLATGFFIAARVSRTGLTLRARI